MKPVTFETLLADQRERIDRSRASKGDNLILDYINDINNELKANEI